MANIFTPSGLVVPASGNINFNSNASSNAVRQVFGETTSNMVGLVGSNVDTGTRPPPYTALTVPTAASGNLKLSYFRGKSLFLTSPTTYNVGNITSATLTPTLAGGGGTSYRIAVGTSSGTSNTVGWQAGTNGTQITGLTFTVGTNYYISAYSSNATNGTASLAIANANAYGIPNNPTSPTITLTTLSNWSVGWTAPTGIAPTGYTWFISNVTASSVFTGPSNTVSTSASGTATLLQDNDYRLYVLAYRPESTSGNTNTASSNLPSPAAPSIVTISSKSMVTDRYTPSITGGSGLYVILGTVSGGSAPTTAWSSGYILQTITTGTSYYLSAKSSNTTTGTTSAVVTSSALGIPTTPASPSIILTSLSNWSVSWAAGSGIAPTGYDWAISNTTTNSLFSNGSTSSTTVSGTSTLLQDNDYQLYVSANRPESYSSTTVSSTSKLPSPAAPSLVTVSSITTSGYTPSITGGSGLYVILGTASGGSTPTTSWSSGVVSQVSAVGTSYYLSAKSSNTTTGTTSAVVTSSAVGIPNVATGVTLTITSMSNWSFSWTAPASGIAPTGYSWYLNTVNNSIVGAIASGTTTSAVTTGARTTALTGGSTYYGIVYATRPESISTLAASAGILTPTPPTSFSVNSIIDTTFIAQAIGSSGATSYRYYLYNITTPATVGPSDIASGTNVTFTGLTPNNQYYVYAFAIKNGIVSSTSVTSASIWCLVAPSSITMSSIATNGTGLSYISWSNSGLNASFVSFNFANDSKNLGSATATSLSYSLSTADALYPLIIVNSNRQYISSFSLTLIGTNTLATSSNVNMVHAMCTSTGEAGFTFTITPSVATTINIEACSGRGGYGRKNDGTYGTYGKGGAAAYTKTTFTSTANVGINCYLGQAGTSVSAPGQLFYAVCGNGSVGGNGGSGSIYEGPAYGGEGGYCAGGGAATFIKTTGVVIALGGGGGGGGGDTQAGNAGNGGSGTGSGTGAQGYSYQTVSDNNGFCGGNGGGNGNGGLGGQSRSTNRSDGGNGTNATGTGTSTTSLGNGGAGTSYYGNLSGGGGGGYGGGGGGDAVNDSGFHDSAGGGGGGSYSSTGSVIGLVTSAYVTGGSLLLYY